MKQAHYDYFDQAYRTGSDIWTHLPYHKTALSMLPDLPDDSLVLDVGSGRGLWVFKLVQLGYRVLGIDIVDSIVTKANQDIKLEGIEGKARFMKGDVLDIPFTDESFSLTTDVGLLQHLEQSDWQKYVAEIARVTKSKGYYLNISLSKETTSFMGWDPKHTDTNTFEKFGVSYYFFEQEEIKRLFKNEFTTLEQHVRMFDAKSDPGDSVALVFSLMQKK